MMPLDLYGYGVLKGGVPSPTLTQRLRALGVTSYLNTSFGTSDDGTDSQWIDSILAGHVLVSQSTLNRLRYQGDTILGVPCWTGILALGTHLLSTDDALASLVVGVTPFAQFFVRQGLSGLSAPYFSFGDTVGPDWHFLAGLPATNLNAAAIRNSGASSISHVGSIVPGISPTIDSYVFSGSDFQIFTNGAQATVLEADALTMSWNRSCVGSFYTAGVSGTSWDGLLGDVVTYVGTISQATRWQIEALLSARWGISVVQS